MSVEEESQSGCSHCGAPAYAGCEHDSLVVTGVDDVLAAPEKTSFADSLQPTEYNARNVKIWALKDRPGILLRESRLRAGQTLDQLEVLMQEAKELFARMGTYGIRVVSPSSERKINKEGKEAIFTTVDKIEGQNLSEIQHLPPEAKEELDQLYASLGRYYYDAWKEGRKFWGDCRSDQFVYGNKYGETEKHFFIVNVDPEFYRVGDDMYHTIEAAIGSLAHDLVEAEAKFIPQARFELARENLLLYIEVMLDTPPVLDLLMEAQELLLHRGG